MSIKDFIQLVEQADIPNMQVLGQLDDGFANIRYNGMAGVLDQQTNKMILISLKIPDSYHIVTVAGGRETTEYVGGSELGPATKKALDSIMPRQRPRPPAPLPVQESYESTEQVRSIVQRMMEDARVPQKPRQGPLRPQTGAGKHKDKKKDQKQGKAKHKGKELDEGRFGRNRDDQFSLGGRLERDNDFRNRERNVGVEHERNNYQVSINGRPWKVFADQRQAMNIARSLRMKGKEVEVYPTGANPSESVEEAAKKPNATTRHLRDYPVSDKDIAKPVKKPEKKKSEQGVAEGYTGRETKDGTWRVFKDGQAVAVAGPFKSRDEAHAWIKKHKQGVAEATGDNKFDTMMGNIKKSAPVSVTGYVAVEYASENKSDRIKGATLKGKPMPSSVDRDDLDGEIEFEPDEIERHLIKIGRDNGWSMIDPGHGRGYSELFFDTNANYTSDNQSILAKNIVNTVNQINKFFSGLNSSLQSTGLPGYRVAVWQEISSSNGQKIGDIDQIKQIALTKVVNSPNDPGELIGKAILQELPAVEQDEYDDFTPEDFAYAKKIAKIYITKGERAGLEAQISNRRMDHVSDLIDELLSLSGAQKYRTLKLDDLDEQGVAEGSLETDNMVSHIGQVIQSIYPRGGDKNTYMKLVAQEMPRIVKANPKLFRRAFGMAYDRFFHIDQDDDFDYTDHSMRQGERGLEEEKQKGVDGKACWKGYKRMGTKKKGGRTVDNCVKMESISEGILSSFGLMEKSPPGFKGTVKAMKKHPELTKGKTKDGKEKNPWALAWHMKNKGYKSHKKADGSNKD